MTDQRIAVVGLACRYPDADTPEKLFDNILDRRKAFRRIPEARLSSDYFTPEDGETGVGDTTYVRRAGILTGWQFPRAEYGVSRKLYDAADHAHWLTLQVADEVLADAGFPDGDGLCRERVGVVLGNTLTGEFSRANILRLRVPFLARKLRATLEQHGVDGDASAAIVANFADDVQAHFPEPDDNSLAGALSNTIAGRVCNHFDFGGLGYTVDGACSSSLLSVELAAQALLNGQLDLALAGGVDLSLDPLELVGFAKLGALAQDEMRVYDRAPTGFIPGEGCGMVALMRAEHAAELQCRTYAWIEGWGVSSDGSGGLTRPVVSGQLRAHERAYRMAGIDPGAVELIEGHGTGTAVGDAVELEVLRSLRATADTQARLGSIKANIGHTKAAAGVAGLMKAVLAVHHRIRPPNTGCEEPHEILANARPTLEAGTDAAEFGQRIPRASVSALGFGGINCTALVAGYDSGRQGRSVRIKTAAQPTPRYDIFPIGAPSRSELRERVSDLTATVGRLSGGELTDLAAALANTGDHTHRFRAVIVGSDPWDTVDALHATQDMIDNWGEPRFVVHPTGCGALGTGPPGRIGLLFPGQAAPVRLTAPDWAAPLGLDFALPEAIAVSPLTDTSIAQPAIIYQSLIGLAWLQAMGCDHQLAVGHSLGELAAYVAGGVLDRQDALSLACARGRVMADHGRPNTTMVSIAAPFGDVEPLLIGTDLQIAGINSPNQTVVSGTTEAIIDFVEAATAAGMTAHQLDVSHGFHSVAMDPVVPHFKEVLAGVDFRPTNRSVFSTITGREITDDTDHAEALVRQLTEPVRFADCIAAIHDRADLLIEVGPGSIMKHLARENGFDGPVVSTDISGDPRHLAITAASLIASGSATPTHWFANRNFRTFDENRSLVILTNPCEDTVTATGSETGPVPIDQDREPQPVRAATELDADQDTLTTVRQFIAKTMELSPNGIRPSASLLADLHLTSLQAVDIAEAIITATGKAPPIAPLAIATATVAELAALIDELPDQDAASAAATAQGVDTWVRTYQHRWIDYDPTTDPSELTWIRWTVPADASDRSAVPDSPNQPTGLVLTVLDEATVPELAMTTSTLATQHLEKIVVVSPGHPAAPGLARALSTELPQVAVTAITSAATLTDEDLRCAARSGYLELRRTDAGYERPLTSVLGLAGEDQSPPGLSPGDVCLVTGGIDGITIECALGLARRTEAIVVALGRSSADSPKIQAASNRLPPDVEVRYLRCDLSNPESVNAACAEAAAMGPVRALLHGAGVNEPRLLGETTSATLTAHLAPKVAGLTNLLSALSDDLDLLVTFGSVIGRCGLEGQSEYCIANDWMRSMVEEWADRHPNCRTRNIEWSVWSGTGMGVQLGAVDRLERSGVKAIPPHLGTQAFLETINDHTHPTTVTISSRFPPSPRLWQDGLNQPLLDRFQEDIVEFAPGIELITQPTIDLTSDPYLNDHQIGNQPVLPAVIGLEAMVQVAAGCRQPATRSPAGWSFDDVRFTTPITVPAEGGTQLQIAALSTGSLVDVRLRSGTDRFATDRFQAIVRAIDEQPPGAEIGRRPGSQSSISAGRLYGPLFFHGPRFHTVDRYHHLSAYHVDAQLQEPPSGRWFSDYHSQELILGSPALNDGIIHLLLASLPNRQALPIGAQRIEYYGAAQGSLRVNASQTSSAGEEYCFDITAHDETGRLVSMWHGLRVRSIGPRHWPDRRIPDELVGPWLSRRLEDLGWPWRVEVTTTTDEADSAAGGSRANARHVATRSVSHHLGSTLAVTADVRVGIDWQTVGADISTAKLGAAGAALATVLAEEHGFDRETAAAAVWTAREALVKLGEDPDLRLIVKLVDETDVLLEGERASVAVVLTRLVSQEDPIAVSLAVAP